MYQESDAFFEGDYVKYREWFLKYLLTDYNEFKKIDFSSIYEWFMLGKLGYQPYDSFYNEFLLLKDDEFLMRELDDFIKCLNDNDSYIETCKKLNISVNKLYIWLKLASFQEEPFLSFYIYFKRIIISKIQEKINLFLDNFDGFNEKEACDIANISEVQLTAWLNLNRIKIDPFKSLYEGYLEKVSKIDYSENCKQFLKYIFKGVNEFEAYEKAKISKNTIDVLFEVKNFDDVDYDDFFNVYSRLFKPHFFTINETYLEYPLDDFLRMQYRDKDKLLILDKNQLKSFNLTVDGVYKDRTYSEKGISEFFNYIAMGFSDYEAAAKSKIPLEDIDEWLMNGIPEFWTNTFSDDYNSSLLLNNYIDYINLGNLDSILSLLRKGEDIFEACSEFSFSIYDLELYLNLGQVNHQPYIIFFRKYQEILKDTFYKKFKIKEFLKEFEKGKTIKDISKKLKISSDFYESFIKKGQNQIEPYFSFYRDATISFKKYLKNDGELEYLIKNGKSTTYKELSKNIRIPVEIIEFCSYLYKTINFNKTNFNKTKEDSHENSDSLEKYEEFINSDKAMAFIGEISKCASFDGACENVGASPDLIKNCLYFGRCGMNKFKNFYEDHKEACEMNTFFLKFEISKEIFLDEIRDGNSFKEACKKCQLAQDVINWWLYLGKNGIEPFNDFQNEYVTLENSYYSFTLNNMREMFLENTDDFSDDQQICTRIGADYNLIKYWLKLGEEGSLMHVVFYNDYCKAKSKIYDEKSSQKLRKKFLKSISKGKSVNEAIYNLGYEGSKIRKWLDFGKSGKMPFNQFYNESEKILIDSYNFEENVELRENFLEFMLKGNSRKKAYAKYKKHSNKLKKWIRLGKSNKEPYNEFYDEIFKIEFNAFLEKNNLNIFLDEIKKGIFIDDALNVAGISKEEFNKIIDNGKSKKYLFHDFLMLFLTTQIEFFDNDYSKLEICINEIKNGVDEKEAVINANLPIGYFEFFLELKDFDETFKQYYDEYSKAIEEEDYYRYENRRKKFLESIELGNTLEKACMDSDLDLKTVRGWLNSGQSDNSKAKMFRVDYDNAIAEGFNSVKNIDKRNKFLSYIQRGETQTNACKKANIESSQLNKWIKDGEKNISPFNSFVKDLNESFISYFEKSRANIENLLNYIVEGNTFTEACKKAEIDSNLVRNWITKGKHDIKPFNKFYEDYDMAIINQFNSKKENINKFFEILESGENNQKACEIAGLNIKVVNKWIKDGEKGQPLYVDFYNRYQEIKY